MKSTSGTLFTGHRPLLQRWAGGLCVDQLRPKWAKMCRISSSFCSGKYGIWNTETPTTKNNTTHIFISVRVRFAKLGDFNRCVANILLLLYFSFGLVVP